MSDETQNADEKSTGYEQRAPMRRRALVIVLLSLFIGIVHIVPYLVFRAQMGSAYQHIYPSFSADEEHYAVVIKNALEGKFDLPNNYIFGEEQQPPARLPRFKSENIIGMGGRALRLNIEQTVVLMRFILPIAMFVLIFLLLKQLEISDYLALALASLNMLAPYALFGNVDFLTRPALDVLISKKLAPLWYDYFLGATLPYARIVNPQFSGLFFVGALICFVRFVKNPRRLFWLALLGALGVCTFRLYFYHWSTLGALIAIFTLLVLLERRWRVALPLLVMLVAGAIYGAHSMLPLLRSANLGGELYGYTLARVVSLSPGVVLALVLLLLYVPMRSHVRSGCDRALYLSLALAIIACMNQQLVTGRIVQPWHYELYVTPLLVSLVLALFLSRTGFAETLLIHVRRVFTKAPTRAIAAVLLIAVGQLIFAASIFFYYFRLAPRLNGALWVCALLALTLWTFAGGLTVMVLQILRDENGVRRALKTGFVIVLALMCLEAIERHTYHALRIMPRCARLQALAPAFQWLNAHTKPGSAVFCHMEIAELVPLYTHNSVLIAKNAIHEHLMKSEAEERLLTYFAVAGYTLETASAMIQEWPFRYVFWGLRTFGTSSDLYSFGARQPITNDELAAVLARLHATAAKPLENLLSRYRTQFVLATSAQQERIPRDFSTSTAVGKALDIEGVQIFEALPHEP